MYLDYMQTIWLIRHAHRLDFIQPEWFDTATYPYDPPLSAEGLARSIVIAKELSRLSIDLIFTSPFLRTIQTVDPLARMLQLPIRLEWGLCEWLCQGWTSAFPLTTPIDMLMVDYPNIEPAYQSLVVPCYPETQAELNLRLISVAYRLVQHNTQNMVAIAHKGSVLGITAILTGDDRWRTYDLPCGGMIKLVWTEDRWLSSIIDR
jgi:broad specificity phosphatase PhoE